MSEPRVSIIISSYNYARYLRHTIESALTQADAEVIVIDDGSSDESPALIRRYGSRVTAVLKPNGGQASAWNEGFQRSRGDWIWFVDSDDVIAAGASSVLLKQVDRSPAPAKAHWQMRAIDADGALLQRLIPEEAPSDGDLKDELLRDGPEAYAWPPTSGNAWSRSFLSRVFPIPAESFRVCPDLYLSALAPLYGPLLRIDQPLSDWRVHDANSTWSGSFESRLHELIRRWDLGCDALATRCAQLGIEVDTARWRRNAWCHSVRSSVEHIIAATLPDARVILVEDNNWGIDGPLSGRPCSAFPGADGLYAGRLRDDEQAVAELDRMRSEGFTHIAIAPAAFWYLEHYPEWARRLREEATPLVTNEQLHLYALRP